MVVALLLAVLAGVLLERLQYYQEAAEKANVEYTISALKSALKSRMATLLLQGRAQEYALLAQDNPLDWLEQKPAGYIGVLANPQTENAPAGSWYFDKGGHELVYLLKSGRHFQSEVSGCKRIRLRVVRVPNLSDTPQEQHSHSTDSVELRLIERYSWL